MIKNQTFKAALFSTALLVPNLALAQETFDFEGAAKARVSHCLDYLYSIKAEGENTPIAIDYTFESCGDGRNMTVAHLMADVCPQGQSCPAIITEFASVEFACNNNILEAVCDIVPNCNADDECGMESWCRPTRNRRSEKSECVPYQQFGESCQGFGDDFDQVRCEPALRCDAEWNPSAPEVGSCVRPERPCIDDSDCFDNSWCRIVDDTGLISECVNYQLAGEGCTGFVPVWMQSRCHPSLTCKAEFLDGPGTCEVQTPVEPGCTSDSQCAANEWCRTVDQISSISECVAYVSEGQACTGFVIPSMREQCDPSLVCVPDDARLPDGPGTCAQPNVSGCSANSDCASDEWCRPVDETSRISECVAYVSEGQACTGFVIPSMREQCDPSLVCVPDDARLPDGPGICADTESSSSAAELSGGAVAGIAIAGAFGVLTFGALICWTLCKSSDAKAAEEESSPSTNGDEEFDDVDLEQ